MDQSNQRAVLNSGIFSQGNGWYITSDKILVVIDKSLLEADYSLPSNLPWADHLSEPIAITFPSGLTKIGAGALRSLINVKIIDIPDGVTRLGNGAITGCSSLTSLRLSKTVAGFGTGVFSEVFSLAEILVVAENPTYTSLDGVLFTKDMKTLVRYPCAKQGAYAIPDSVTKLDGSVFYGCSGSLTELTIPSGLTNISASNFSGCYSLIAVHVHGETEQIWNRRLNGWGFPNGCQIKWTDHQWVTTQNQAPTCTTAGSNTNSCQLCGKVEIVSVPALGHTLVDVSGTPATCTTNGITNGKKCSRCGHWEVPQITIPVLGHDLIDIPETPATCTTGGLTAGRKCSRCAHVEVVQTPTPALGHSYNEGVITTPPTCTGKGVKTFTCTRCGFTRTEEVDATGHTPASELSGYVAPTHTTPGYSGDVVCATCGQVLTAGHEIAASGHIMGEWTSTGPLTHTRVCSDGAECNVETEPHQFNVTISDKATPTTPGTLTKQCTVCGETITHKFIRLKHRKPNT